MRKFVNPDFTAKCKDRIRNSRLLPRAIMAFGLFKKRVPEAVALVPEAKTPSRVDVVPVREAESSREILDLLDLELGGLIRQLERAAPRRPPRALPPSASGPAP